MCVILKAEMEHTRFIGEGVAFSSPSPINPVSQIPDTLHNYDVIIFRRSIYPMKPTTTRATTITNNVRVIFERKSKRKKRNRSCTCCCSWFKFCKRNEETKVVLAPVETQQAKPDVKDDSSPSSSSSSSSSSADNASHHSGRAVVHERVGMIFFLNDIFPGITNKGAMFYEFSKGYENTKLFDLITQLPKESGTALFYLEDVVMEEVKKCERTNESSNYTLAKLEMLWRQLDRSLDISNSVEEIELESTQIYTKLWQLRRVFSLETGKAVEEEGEENAIGSGGGGASEGMNAPPVEHFRQPGKMYSAMRQIARRNRNSVDAIMFSTLEEVFGEVLLFSGFVQSGVGDTILQTLIRRLFFNPQASLLLKGDVNSRQSNFYFEAVAIDF